MKLRRFVGLLVLSFLITQSMGDIVYSRTGCQFEQELQTYTNPIKIEDININTIVIGNFLTRIGEKSYKELIYGTFDSRVLIRDAVSLEYCFSIEAENNVKGIKLEDLNPNDSQIKYNELIFWDESNNLYIYDNNLNSLLEKKIEYPIVDITFLDADNDNKIDIVVATKNGIYTFNGKGNLIWGNSRFDKLEGILVLNFLEQKQSNKEEIIAITQNKLLIYGYNGGFIESIDFTPEIIKDFKIWKESRKDCLIVLTYDKENKISKVYKISETYGKYLTYTVKKDIKNIFSIYSKIYTGIENDFVILFYENRALEMITPTNLHKDNSYVWREKFDGNIVSIENFDLEGHLINSEEQYYSIINDNKEIIITTDLGDIYVYYWDQNDQKMKCYSEFQRKEDIQEKIVFSRILDLDHSRCNYVIQVSKSNTIYLLEIFKKECNLIYWYKNAEYYYDKQDYKTAKSFFESCIKEEDREITENYYRIYNDSIEKIKKIDEEFQKIVPEADEKLKEGIKFFNLRDDHSALKKLFNAYQKYEEAGFEYQRALNNDLTFWDLRGILFYLDLSILKKADEELKKENYESALDEFVAMYPSFEYLDWNINDIILNYGKKDERFFQFEPLEENYKTISMIKSVIETQCFKNLEEDAQSLMDESKYEEAKSQYEKLDGYREKLGEKEDSEKRKEYKEKIRECDEKIRDIWVKRITSFIILLVVLIVLYFVFFRKKRLLKEKTSKGFNLQLDKAEDMLEYDVKSAAQFAGRKLELLLKIFISKNPELIKAWKEKYPKKVTKSPMSLMIEFLKREEQITKNEYDDLKDLNRLRNLSSHEEIDLNYIETQEIEREEIAYIQAKAMIERIRYYVNKFLD